MEVGAAPFEEVIKSEMPRAAFDAMQRARGVVEDVDPPAKKKRTSIATCEPGPWPLMSPSNVLAATLTDAETAQGYLNWGLSASYLADRRTQDAPRTFLAKRFEIAATEAKQVAEADLVLVQSRIQLSVSDS